MVLVNSNIKQSISKAVKEGVPPYVVYMALQESPEILGLSEDVVITEEIIEVLRTEYQSVKPIEELSVEDVEVIDNLLAEEDNSIYQACIAFYIHTFFEEDTQERTNNAFFYLVGKNR